ncbi:MAG: NAD-dependent epimerase/dehydratase family protein [Pirellulales bacterium]
MNVIVAGGSGFLGRHVVEELARRGHRLTVLARGTRTTPDTHDGNVETIACDVAAGGLPIERLRGADAIVNLIGIKRDTAAQTFQQVHVDAVRQLIELGATDFRTTVRPHQRRCGASGRAARLS